jgi:hypothetical protein
MAANSFLQVRVTDDTKQRFARVAEQAGLTESGMLPVLVNDQPGGRRRVNRRRSLTRILA